MKKGLLTVLLLALLLCVSTAAAEIRLTQVEGGMDGDVMELVKGSFAMQIEGSEVGEIYRIELSGRADGWYGTYVVQDGFVGGEPYLFRVQITDGPGKYGPVKLTVTGGGETVTREYMVRAALDAGDAGVEGVATNRHRENDLPLVLLESGQASDSEYGIIWPPDGSVFSGQKTGGLNVVYRVEDKSVRVDLMLPGENRLVSGYYSQVNKPEESTAIVNIPAHLMRYDVPYQIKVTCEDTNKVYTSTFTIKQETFTEEPVETVPVETLLTTRAPRVGKMASDKIQADDQFFDEVVAFMDAHLPRTVTDVNEGEWGDYRFGYDNDRDKSLHFGSIMVAYPEAPKGIRGFKFTDYMLDEMASLLTYTNKQHYSKFSVKPVSSQGHNPKVKVDNRMTSSGFEVVKEKGKGLLRVQPFSFADNKNNMLNGQLYIYLSLEGALPSGFMSDCQTITWVCSKPEEVKGLLDIMMSAAPNLTLDESVTYWYNKHSDTPKPAEDKKAPAAANGQEKPAAANGQEKPADAASMVKITGNCNIRSEPNGSGKKLGTGKAGDTYPCLGVADNGWFNIVLPDGREGYISGAFGEFVD